MRAAESVRRTIIKTVSYRIMIVVLDFTAIYLFTGQFKIAFGFMIVSNIYTSVAYFMHERLWDRIRWGILNYRGVYK